jgi:glucose-6-phosphate-specific signal transduction histidine kinase
MQRPAGVTAIAALFSVAALYLWTIGMVKLLAPNAITLMAGAQLMYGLELAGPYMALLVGAGWALVGWGLLRVHNWARWAAMLVMVIGIAWLVPKISQADFGWSFAWDGLQISLRAAAAWYLAQAPAVIDAFSK